jgi:ribA/ribD-fused uncharacterized protein
MNIIQPVIDNFVGEYFFLSNFHHRTFQFQGDTWPTAEHAFQAMKTHDEAVRASIRVLETPREARQFGRHEVELRNDWEAIKDVVMFAVLCHKFSSRHMQDLLKATAPAVLIEGNKVDTYWGVVDGEGQNKLGQLLMLIRDGI